MPASSLDKLRKSARPLGVLALAILVAAAVVVVVSLSNAARTLLTAVDTTEVQQNEQKQLDQFAERQKRFASQINGRSLFFAPRAPHAEAPPAVATTPSTPSRPTHYSGPSVIAMINNRVWFSDGSRLAPGEHHDDLEVVGLSPPWSAKVRWQGVEFDVGLFERDSVVYRRADASSTYVRPAPASYPSTGSTPTAPASSTPARPASAGGSGGTAAGGVVIPLTPPPPVPPPEGGGAAPPEGPGPNGPAPGGPTPGPVPGTPPGTPAPEPSPQPSPEPNGSPPPAPSEPAPSPSPEPPHEPESHRPVTPEPR